MTFFPYGESCRGWELNEAIDSTKSSDEGYTNSNFDKERPRKLAFSSRIVEYFTLI